MAKKGGISVQTENIFPVIKRWLYSDKDIFMRELVSNACDAITKHSRLVSLAQTEEFSGQYRVDVAVSKKAKTIRISDNGIGMNEDELDKYINQIALSGALDFIAKYEGSENAENGEKSGIIGHFGLGFYSAFIVADKVEIETRSYNGASAVHWACDEAGSFEMEDGERETQGTDIILHVNEQSLEYLDSVKLKEVLVKYCSFMPFPVFFGTEESDLDEGETPSAEQINDTDPLWRRSPSELSEEDYNAFYKKLFNDYRDPLFYIHVVADYPLNFKGILYFPASRNEFEQKDGAVKLYYNSVFVADNIKEVVPDYLSAVKGVLDCPELPLNVSRSYLQDDAYVKKISAYIVKKLGDTLNKLYSDDPEKYFKLWDSIAPFIEYGCMQDSKLFDRIKTSIVFKLTDGSHVSLDELTKDAENSEEGKIYYASDLKRQSYYTAMFKEKGFKVLALETIIDTQFASFIESKNEKLHFLRVDSDLKALEGDQTSDLDISVLKKLFAEASGKPEEKLSFAPLGEASAPALIRLSEESRRFADMMNAYKSFGGLETDEIPVEEELTVNTDCPAIQKLASSEGEKANAIAKHIYLLAVLSNRQLTSAELEQLLENEKKLFDLMA